MKKVNRSQQPPAKRDWPPKSSYVGQATSKMTDEIKELLHDAINVGIQNSRMLKFLCIRARVMDFKDLDDASAMPLHGKALVRLKKLLEASPDISDILEEK